MSFKEDEQRYLLSSLDNDVEMRDVEDDDDDEESVEDALQSKSFPDGLLENLIHLTSQVRQRSLKNPNLRTRLTMLPLRPQLLGKRILN